MYLQYMTPASNLGARPVYSSVVKNQYGNVTYYSGVAAEIYFEDEFIDETVQIQFQLQQNTLPLFGYNSYIYDDVAVGSRIISGMFAINFTRSEYMYEVLNVLKQIPSSKGMSVNKTSEATISEYDSTKAILNPKNGDPMLNRMSNPLWDHRFSMIMSYGSKKRPNSKNTLIKLVGVQLTGCSQQFDVSGNPILEVYTFIARDLVPAVISVPGQMEVNVSKPPVDDDFVSISSPLYSEKRIDVNGTKVKASKISFDYKSPYQVKRITFEPELNVSKRWSTTGHKDMRLVNGTATFDVDELLRRDIVEHCKKSSSFNVNIKVHFIKDGKESSQVITEKFQTAFVD